MKEIIDHFERIAKINEDSFLYQIVIYPYPKQLKCYFEVMEDSDSHVLFSTDFEFDKPLVIPDKEIRSACESWNYKYVD